MEYDGAHCTLSEEVDSAAIAYSLAEAKSRITVHQKLSVACLKKMLSSERRSTQFNVFHLFFA